MKTTYRRVLVVVLLPLQFWVHAFVPSQQQQQKQYHADVVVTSRAAVAWWRSSSSSPSFHRHCDVTCMTRLYDEPPTTTTTSSTDTAAIRRLNLNVTSSSSSSSNTTEDHDATTPTTTTTATNTPSRSFGNLIMKMQRRARNSRRRAAQKNISSSSGGNNINNSHLEEEISSLELNATTESIMNHPENYDDDDDDESEYGDNNNLAEDDHDDSYLGSVKSTIASTFGFPFSSSAANKKSEIGKSLVGGGFKSIDWKTAQELDQDVTYYYSSSTKQDQEKILEDASLMRNVVELPLDKRQLLGQQAHLLELQRQREQQQQQQQQQRQTVSSSATTTRTTLSSSSASSSSSSLRDARFSSRYYYQHRIGRDLCMAAVSVAANTDTVAEWRNACRLMNGIYPLVHDAIRQGAVVLQLQSSSSSSTSSPLVGSNNEAAAAAFEKSTSTTPALVPEYYNLNPQSASLEAYNRRRLLEEEASLQLACLACRAIRDLCALSPEMATVITDSLLRYNQARNGELMQDFCTLLEYKHPYHAAAAVTNMDNDDNNNNHRLFKRQRRRFRYRVQKFRGGLGGNNMSSDQQLLRAHRSKRKKNRNQRDARRQCQLYVTQLLLAMTVASDHAVHAIRNTNGLSAAILACSSYTSGARRRRWLRYPGEMIKWLWRSSRISRQQQDNRKQRQHQGSQATLRRPFLEAATLGYDLNGQIQRTANQVLAAIGCNQWIPKIPGQRGLRILALDGGGSRGMVSVTAVRCLVEAATNGVEVSDSFDMIVGTSTGGIISFLTGLRRETSVEALNRYNQLIKQIFVKSALSTPLLLFTTASYDESRFMDILGEILQDESMLDSRADPTVPYVFAVTSKMSSTPTHIALFRNYNYAAGELPDPFTISAEAARRDLNLPLELEHPEIQTGNYPPLKDTSYSPRSSYTDRRGDRNGKGEQRVGSRNPGSFRVLQRYALRASTAAPTVFKPVLMGGEMYCDGGIVASNPAAVAIHEARALFPDIPIELIVSLGTGAFKRQKSPPRIGWDGIVNQIVDSATDAEAVHHILEDVLGEPEMLGRRSLVSQTRYYRFNPTIGLPEEFPIDVTSPEKLSKLRRITRNYMNEPEQKAKMEDIADILNGRHGWKKWWRR